jgi:hypothetical protein
MLLRQNEECCQRLSDSFNNLFCIRANILVYFLLYLLSAYQSIGEAQCKSYFVVNGRYYSIFVWWL